MAARIEDGAYVVRIRDGKLVRDVMEPTGFCEDCDYSYPVPGRPSCLVCAWAYPCKRGFFCPLYAPRGSVAR